MYGHSRKTSSLPPAPYCGFISGCSHQLKSLRYRLTNKQDTRGVQRNGQWLIIIYLKYWKEKKLYKDTNINIPNTLWKCISNARNRYSEMAVSSIPLPGVWGHGAGLENWWPLYHECMAGYSKHRVKKAAIEGCIAKERIRIYWGETPGEVGPRSWAERMKHRMSLEGWRESQGKRLLERRASHTNAGALGISCRAAMIP